MILFEITVPVHFFLSIGSPHLASLPKGITNFFSAAESIDTEIELNDLKGAIIKTEKWKISLSWTMPLIWDLVLKTCIC